MFFHEEFYFHDGETGEKLFVALGNVASIHVVAKTTSKQHGRGTSFGCQPEDRFHNAYLPPGCCYLRCNTWVCLDEFYEFGSKAVLAARFSGLIKPVCDLPKEITRMIQECALESLDISPAQTEAVRASLV
ncbi:hypothetical protein MKK88_18980 [Methylobacterium sp. E-005]|uniref:hypothetical protein n=1 Tax=Methylobacterium sp. E-005 TaxID=2836549 RepID=UPI001FB9309B|nr:hypothetical protein [Methylobacterium sp. E-005]MCJ2088051.1 hypothetical protein [Methylobacterium sp. E-005]